MELILSKILVLGNETVDTDFKTTELASSSGLPNHGLITDPCFVPNHPGYYHTTVIDLSPGQIAHIATHFTYIMLLDQPVESYPHVKSLLTTVRLCYDLEQSGLNVSYRDIDIAKNVLFWRQYLQENKSFCFYPFLGLVNNGENTVQCPKKYVTIKKLDDITDWQNDPEYLSIRNKMIAGELIPERCSDCYEREAEGQESTRQYETLEWTQRISASSVDDFRAIKSPKVYEIRPNNKCNIMCRTCDPNHSHLIEKEWRDSGYRMFKQINFASTPFDKIDFNSAVSVYIGGGEPTVMPEFYDFLRKCIDAGKTDFEFNIGTNALKISDKALELLRHFNHACFAISLDGYGKVNDYIRWRSDFNTIIENSRKLRAEGHKVSLQTVFSMYNATRIHELFEFYDQEFPDSGCLVNVATGEGDIYLPYNHPAPELVIHSMERCQQTGVYFNNGRSIKSMVDLMLEHYCNPTYTINKDLLRKFYAFNDMLDASRGSKLIDYIPELEEGRKLV